MSEFTHLHLHTQYSILDGASGIKPLMKRVKELGMTSVAITDHGNMFGVKAFHKEANANGIKPILGCEVYVASSSRYDKNGENDRGGDHLILLAKNLTGYHNLMKMVSYSWTEGFYYKPRVDKELLERYSEGLVCCSACLGGELPQAIISGNMSRVDEVITWYKRVFGNDYYLELQCHKSTIPNLDAEVFQNQIKVNKLLLELSTRFGIKAIVSNDVHFINAEDASAHDLLICLNTGRDIDDPKRMRYTGQEFLKSYDQMLTMFPDHPELLSNTQEIVDKIEEFSLNHKPFMPNFPIPDDFEIDPEGLKAVFMRSLDKDISQEKNESKRVALQELVSNLSADIQGITSCEGLDEIVVKYGQRAANLEDHLTISKQHKYLEFLTWRGAEARYKNEGGIDVNKRERIEFELSTIEWMGFPGYFLIVWDFIRAAREMGVSVGPGRGSAAGSVVAYSLGITNIDPIKYNLLFERFLNPERISMPDVDIDFDEDGRADVLKYVVEKYGQKRVAQIVTFGTMAARMAIKDVARVQRLDLRESDRLAKLVPEKPGTTLAQAFKEVPELAQELKSPNELIKSTLQYAQTLEGSVRQTGVHACGVIIGQDDLENFIPIATAKDADLFVVQYDGKHVEDVGLLKMDFLGLKTLSIIKDALENIELSKGITIDIEAIPLDDAKTFSVYSHGDTTGLFQFESPGMKKHLRNLKPSRFEDLIAMNALYRPGPIEYIPMFIARKHGTEKIEYDLPEMEEYLSDTYGITVYQEQVMLLSQKLAGFTKGQADTLRKAMGKKLRDVLDKMKGDFMKGAAERGHDAKICDKIWGDWEKFAQYAFNKSHSTCYAYISYQTAYLKAHYPSEFMAALLSRNLSDIKKISFFMDESKRMGISVKGPDVNQSVLKFSVNEEGDVLFGLGAIKGVGEGAVMSFFETRKTGGKFTSIYDFFERINLQTVNKKCLENLCVAGAFDSITNFHRSKFFTTDIKGTTFLEQLIRYGLRMQTEKSNSQQSLFGESAEGDVQKPDVPQEEPWGKLETLNREREVIGIYLSSHPLDEYRIVIENFSSTPLSSFENLNELKDRDFAVAGMVTAVQHLMSKNGKPYGRFTIEDYTDSHEFTLFGKDYEQFRNYCYPNYYLLIRGRVGAHPYRPGELDVKISSISTLDDCHKLIKECMISLPYFDITEDLVLNLSRLVRENPGNLPLKFKIFDPYQDIVLSMASHGERINLTNDLVSLLDDYNLKYTLS